MWKYFKIWLVSFLAGLAICWSGPRGLDPKAFLLSFLIGILVASAWYLEDRPPPH